MASVIDRRKNQKYSVSIQRRFKEKRVTITASIGATLLRQGDRITSALERADQALYRAKHAGRDQIVMD
nr:diguanylate cyclase [Oceanisphaera litoralis]